MSGWGWVIKQMLVMIIFLIVTVLLIRTALHSVMESGLKSIIVCILAVWLYNRFSRFLCSDCAGVELEGVRTDGELIRWEEIEGITGNGNKAEVLTQNGRIKNAKLSVEKLMSGPDWYGFNDLKIEPGRITMSRLPKLELRVIITEKATRQSIMCTKWFAILQAMLTLIAFEGWYFTRTSIIGLIIGLVGIFCALAMAISIRIQWVNYQAGVRFIPSDVCLLLTSDYLELQVGGECNCVCWADIESVREIEDSISLYRGLVILSTANNGKLGLPNISVKIKNLISEKTGVGLK